jgi:hypothetical protein
MAGLFLTWIAGTCCEPTLQIVKPLADARGSVIERRCRLNGAATVTERFEDLEVFTFLCCGALVPV